MIRVFILSTLVFGIWSFSLAEAEIYKYKDDQGVVRYTYDLGEVPENQRPGVKTYEEEAVSPTALPTDERAGEASSDDSGNTQEENASPVVDEQKIEELKQKKKELDQEFANLMEEKYKLIKEKENLDKLAGRDAAAVAEYDKKAKELNRKIADYQKRQESFQKEAKEAEKAFEKNDADGS